MNNTSRTKFYRDPYEGKILGVNAGIADYTGLDVTLVRMMFLASVLLSGGMMIPLYIMAGMIAPKRPPELTVETDDEKKFWQGVRANPSRSAKQIKSRFRDIDRRLADIEHYVTTENRVLAQQIDDLR
ncbi:envelope stress response membrane protein PspC [Sphingomicrobium nitratireducens]|uniref:envelope stress response membrane protein PspC n=1 Tax=Sphingomicrobium nitratireducens TaxID=2964666 RepID=UPI002240922A|nr:envelope stress response membrane protein PspC [Sphingomicrobium nitratireducens]